jgi:hypothetical protein
MFHKISSANKEKAIPLYRDPTLQCSKANMNRYLANVAIPIYRDNSPLRIATYRTTNQNSNFNIC